jgi:hypothetical protein
MSAVVGPANKEGSGRLAQSTADGTRGNFEENESMPVLASRAPDAAPADPVAPLSVAIGRTRRARAGFVHFRTSYSIGMPLGHIRVAICPRRRLVSLWEINVEPAEARIFQRRPSSTAALF